MGYHGGTARGWLHLGVSLQSPSSRWLSGRRGKETLGVSAIWLSFRWLGRCERHGAPKVSLGHPLPHGFPQKDRLSPVCSCTLGCNWGAQDGRGVLVQNAGMGPPGLHEGSSRGSGQPLPGWQVLTGHKAPLMNMGGEGSAHPSSLGSGDASLGHKEAALQGTGSGSDPAGTGTHDREEPVLSSPDPWLLPPSISIPHYPPSQPCRPLHLASVTSRFPPLC